MLKRNDIGDFMLKRNGKFNICTVLVPGSTKVRTVAVRTVRPVRIFQNFWCSDCSSCSDCSLFGLFVKFWNFCCSLFGGPWLWERPSTFRGPWITARDGLSIFNGPSISDIVQIPYDSGFPKSGNNIYSTRFLELMTFKIFAWQLV